MQIKTIITFIVVTLGVLLGVGGLLWQFGSTSDQPVVEIAGEKKHVKGTGSVTIVEFSDFQCPACLAVQEPLKQLLTTYEGKVEFVYRHFPLVSIHKNAMAAALASEAADMQGKFWEMHDLLFAKQAEWSSLGDPKEVFVGYAETMGIDKAKFISDLEGQGARDLVTADVLASTRYKLTGTPTFFVNGVKTEFGQIEAKLAELTK